MKYDDVSEQRQTIDAQAQMIMKIKEFIGVELDKETNTYVSGKPPYLSAGCTETEAVIAAVSALRIVADVLAEKNTQQAQRIRELEAELARVKGEVR